MPSFAKHGYSKGIAYSDKDKIVIYLLVNILVIGNVPEVLFKINEQKNKYFKIMKKIKNDGECKV